jgi:hypothetical protein
MITVDHVGFAVADYKRSKAFDLDGNNIEAVCHQPD